MCVQGPTRVSLQRVHEKYVAPDAEHTNYLSFIEICQKTVEAYFFETN